MDEELTPETQSRIRALCESIARRDQLGEDVQEELRGHIEDKMLGYLAGKEAVTEDDALLLAAEHFGDSSNVRNLRLHGTGGKRNVKYLAACLLTVGALAGIWYWAERVVAKPRRSQDVFYLSEQTKAANSSVRANSTPQNDASDDRTRQEHSTVLPAPILQTPESPLPQPVRTDETGTISGTVRVNGTLASRYKVHVEDRNFPRTATVAANGTFQFDRVPVGPTVVSLRADGEIWAQRNYKQVDVTANAVAQVEFNLIEGTASLAGVVARDGVPLAEIRLSLVIDAPGYDSFHVSGTTDARGAYLFEQLPAGAAALKVLQHTERFEEPVYEAIIVEGARKRFDIELAASALILGQVHGNPKGWQLMGALVRGKVAMPQPDLASIQRAIWDRMVIGGTMSEDGIFELKEIPPGSYTALVYSTPPGGEAEGFKQAAGEVVVEEGDEIVETELTLE